MKTRMLLLAMLVVAGLWAATTWADPIGPGGPGGPMGHGRMFGDRGAMMFGLLLKRANLTPEQTQQVQKIMQADRDTLRNLSKQLEDANDQLADKLFAPGAVKMSDLAPQEQRVVQLRQQLMDQGLKTALAVRAVLTPEQLAKAAQLKDRLQKLHAEMRSIFEGTD